MKKIVAWRKKEEGIRRRIKEDLIVHVEENENEKRSRVTGRSKGSGRRKR